VAWSFSFTGGTNVTSVLPNQSIHLTASFWFFVPVISTLVTAVTNPWLRHTAASWRLTLACHFPTGTREIRWWNKHVSTASIKHCSETRSCRMEVLRDGRPAEYRCGKRRAVLSNYTVCLKKPDTPIMSHNSSKSRTLSIMFDVINRQLLLRKGGHNNVRSLRMWSSHAWLLHWYTYID